MLKGLDLAFFVPFLANIMQSIVWNSNLWSVLCRLPPIVAIESSATLILYTFTLTKMLCMFSERAILPLVQTAGGCLVVWSCRESRSDYMSVPKQINNVVY